MQPDMARVGRRVRELRKKLGLNQTRFGKLLDVDQATVSRWESDQQRPEGETLVRLARLAQMSVEEFLGDAEVRPRDINEVVVLGAVQAGEWVEALEWPADDQYEVTVPDHPTFRSFRRFGLEVIGPSMDRVYAEGTVVTCVLFADIGRMPVHGERAIVQRRRDDGRVEVTIKEYCIDAQGDAWLWPRSHHPAYQQPIPLPRPGDSNGTEHVEILALVIGSYQHEKPKA